MNKYDERNKAHQNVSVVTKVLSAGGTNTQVLAVAAGQRARVFGYSVDQLGTGTATVTLHFTGGKVIATRELPTGSVVDKSFAPHYVEGGNGADIEVDLDDQASDNCTVSIEYTLEND